MAQTLTSATASNSHYQCIEYILQTASELDLSYIFSLNILKSKSCTLGWSVFFFTFYEIT